MLPAFKGRINRKTFVLGNVIGLALLGVVGIIYMLPLFIVDIFVGGQEGSSPIFRVLYSLFVIPTLFYLFFGAVLFVKRMHDIGYPGMLLLWIFIILEGLALFADIRILNLLVFVILLGVCALPGQKVRNGFGPVPQKKFKVADLVLRF